MKEATTKIFIDCDPGIDDFIAILAALNLPQLDVVGLASVAGNLPIQITTANIAVALEVAERKEIPYAKGAGAPLWTKAVTAEQVHGKSGLGSLSPPPSSLQPVQMDGADFLYHCANAHPHELVVVAIGPLTNLATALVRYPHLPALLKKIVLMGGAHAHGNVTPKAEFNIFADPHAAHIVFECGGDITMVGLDATMAVGLSSEECMSLSSGSVKGEMIATLLKDICQYNKAFGSGEVAYIHDLAAVMCVLWPEVFTLLPCHVAIELKGDLTFGQTVCDITAVNKKPPNAKVALGVHEQQFLSILTDLLKQL
ncbi:MAG: nucleoside hydrolase [Clostridiales bacterium]|nr:nucleoside hydrolase [Clostridiales bacterium]